ncbi:MAG TPA: hypothetical protein VM513_11570 [Kofleriaceae bacterium]|jgi:hypothetical protein|nr:hypothetical protein [Kofleriaceae bacterium]
MASLHAAHACTDCGKPVDVESPGAPVGEVRIVGRNGRGHVVELCSRCFIKRGAEEAQVVEPRGRR